MKIFGQNHSLNLVHRISTATLKPMVYYSMVLTLILFSGCGFEEATQTASRHETDAKLEAKFLDSPGALEEFGWKELALISDQRIPECSGMAISLKKPECFYMHNDRGNVNHFYAVDFDGEVLAAYRYSDMMLDWEDMAQFSIDGKSHLLVGYCGDGGGGDERRLLIFEEPDIPKVRPTEPLSLKPEWIIPYRFKDGLIDVESVAVDVIAQKVYLITKNVDPAKMIMHDALFELPLYSNERINTPKALGFLRKIPPLMPHETDNKWAQKGRGHEVTSCDLTPDGLHLLVLTHGDAFIYSRNQSEDWGAIVEQKIPLRVRLPGADILPQREAACFIGRGLDFLVSSENPDVVFGKKQTLLLVQPKK
ncbi:MAG: hypothetical protein ACJZ65_03320 [Limisphaerales bacterium]